MRTIMLALTITILAGAPFPLAAQKCDLERAACHWQALHSRELDIWSCELDYWDCVLLGIRTS